MTGVAPSGRVLALEFPDNLPVAAARERIADAIRRHQVVVIAGETGSGKTTQLPKICLAAGRASAGLIGHTQPRRIAARRVAARIAHELGTRVGEEVGYKVRFHEEAGAGIRVKVMTDGILVAEASRDRRLAAYGTLILDEAHERSLNLDFLFGHLHRLLAERPELKLIISSATLESERIARFFDDAPVLEIEGRAHPVEVRHVEHAPDDPVAAVPDAVRAVVAEGPGDILVFLPGEREIRETARALRPEHAAFEVLPLYARLNHTQQERVFRPSARRRVVLATNVAETSITVPGIRYVIDTGLERVSRYNFRTKVQRLPIQPVSRASAEQRRGRSGRVGPGVCVRLYTEEDFAARPSHPEPEIRRTNLAAVVLRMAANRLGRIEDFPFIEPPDQRFVADGRRLLRELGALNPDDRITRLGRRLARLPVEPRIGRMILAAGEFECVAEILVIAAALSAGDPRDSSPEAREQAAAAHAPFTDQRSDFMTWVNLWHEINRAGGVGRGRGSGWRRYCRAHHLSERRVREWFDLHRQLVLVAREIGLRPAAEPATYARIHRAVLAGNLAHIGVRSQGREYRGPGERMFVLSPASCVRPSGQPWIVANALIETSTIHAHAAARIRPQWVERAARDLVVREYFEPAYDPDRGEVMANERVLLFGLVLIPRRPVRFAPVEPVAARAIFISEGLVAGQCAPGLPFERHNRAVLEAGHEIETRARRRDILAGDDARIRFFESRLPPDIVSERGLRRWHDASPEHAERLCFALGDIVRPAVELPAPDDFPDAIEVAGTTIELAYRFAPDAPDDGITARVPLTVLGALAGEPFSWLVPGAREEKAAALLRTLPRGTRRRLAPLRDTARRCLAWCDEEDASATRSIEAALAAALGAVAGVEVQPADFEVEALPAHVRMRFEVVDANGQVLGEGRSFEELQARFRREAKHDFTRVAEQSFERDGLTRWCFGDLPEHIEVEHGGVRVRGFPALEDRGKSVALRLFEHPARAAAAHPRGLFRLALLSLHGELRTVQRAIGSIDRLALHHLLLPVLPSAGEGASGSGDLKSELFAAAVRECCLEGAPDIRNHEEFERLLADGAERLVPTALALRDLFARIIGIWDEARQLRAGLDARAYPDSLADFDEHFVRLVHRGFLPATSLARLGELPRYLEAAKCRLDRLPRNPARDLAAVEKVRPLWEEVRGELDRARGAPLDPVREECRWLLEELRVSLFAQELGTRVPVSVPRIARAWAERPPPAPAVVA